MPSWRRRRPAPAPDPGPVRRALTAAAHPVDLARSLIVRKESWQADAWGHYDAEGEFRYGVDWIATGLSRVRLVVGKRVAGQDEPEPVKDGPAVELLGQLGGGVGGQSELLYQFGTLLSVPGDSYLIGRETDGGRTWGVYSPDVVKAGNGGKFELRTSEKDWVQLGTESLVCRVYNPHPRFQWQATSPARAALKVLREIDMYDRHIMATLLSRLAWNGVWLVPSEVSFDTPPQYADAPDPLTAQIMDVASRSIAEPGSAAAAIPLILRASGEHLDKFIRQEFASSINKDVLDARDKALARLASISNIPAEILTGLGDVNHWSAWQISDAAVQQHIAPVAETICQGLTTGYLRPMLAAAGADDPDLVVWYDTSEVASKPDRAQNARDLYDRGELTGAALRRENGFDEGDKPEPDERNEIILMQMARGSVTYAAYNALVTGTLLPAAAPPPGQEAPTPPQAAEPSAPPRPGGGTLPDTAAEPPPATTAAARLRAVNGARKT